MPDELLGSVAAPRKAFRRVVQIRSTDGTKWRQVMFGNSSAEVSPRRQAYPWRVAPWTTVVRESLSDFFHSVGLPLLFVVGCGGLVVLFLSGSSDSSPSVRQTMLQLEADRVRQQRAD